MSNPRILVIAAHPDDEVLGCGGVTARFALDGASVRTVILGEGGTSRVDGGKDEVDGLALAAREAAKALGLESPVMHGLPDNRFDSLDLLDIVKIVEKEVTAFEPTIIFTHHPGDLNIDHGLTARAVVTASRPMAGCPVKEIYAFEVGSSTEWGFGAAGPAFMPNTYFDISRTLERKVAALARYETETQPFPHPRSAEAVRARAMVRGSESGFEAAEAAWLLRRLA